MTKFTPVDLDGLFNLTPETMSPPWETKLPPEVARLPAERQTFWGIPFALGMAEGPRWIGLRGEEQVTVPVAGFASYLVLAHFCNASQPIRGWPDALPGMIVRPGEHLADYVLVYRDGTEAGQAIRRRFEINEAFMGGFGVADLAFAAQPNTMHRPLDWRGPCPRNTWGAWQQAIGGGRVDVVYWLYALPNPHPEKELASLVLKPTGADCLAVGGLTLYHGDSHPLRRQRLTSFRLTLPEGEDARRDEAVAEVDLGTITRRYAVPAFDPESWLSAECKGWGERSTGPGIDLLRDLTDWIGTFDESLAGPANELRLDMTASADATLSVNGHAIELESVYDTGQGTSRDGAVRIEVVGEPKQWVQVSVEDATTGVTTPARVHFRSPDGRYLPPYGHRTEVNDNWFEDHGADLKLGSTEYAYVDGRFRIELPVGDVYVEAVKGFEYEPLRQKLEIQPGQKELVLRLDRPLNLREKGWVTADTHVHFLSPQTAWLEAQAEGVNLVNLLASQWGELFTSVGDLTGDLSGVSRDDTLVWVGTENRQHMMGHINLLAGRGEPVYPMTTDGPNESRIGDPIEASLAEWADRCREREGLVILPHWPEPYLEAVADIILGKVDGLEIRHFSPRLDNHCIQNWYRYLNMGYRLPAVGGTDKMLASMPLGGIRTYAHLGDKELTFPNWAQAVRSGRTFTTSGPIIGLSADGHELGEEIRLPTSGGTLEVDAWATSLQPIHELQLVVGGKVVDSVTEPSGTRRLNLRTRVPVRGSTWMAARCLSQTLVWHYFPVFSEAHTSPIYIAADDGGPFNQADASFMLTMLDGGLAYLDTLSIPASPEKHEQIKSVFRQAQAELHRRAHAHGARHSH